MQVSSILPIVLIRLLVAAALTCSAIAQDETNAATVAVPTNVQGEPERTIEAPSPDGKFAFLRTEQFTDRDVRLHDQGTYDLIEKQSGKVVARVAESDPYLKGSASARFVMKVLWRPDSKAFALTAALWKRGSDVHVYLREGTTFREIKLPESVLDAEVPKKMRQGKDLQKQIASTDQEAKQWRKDGSLVMQTTNAYAGNDGTVSATRTTRLAFDSNGKARILDSTLKFTTEND